MNKIKIGIFSWRVTNLRALLILMLFGGLGLHRLYVGRWVSAMMLFAYTVGGFVVERFIVYPSVSLSWESKENISSAFLFILFGIMIWDLIHMRQWIDDVNSPRISEIIN